MSKSTIRKKFEKPKSTIKKELPSRSRVMCFVNHEYKGNQIVGRQICSEQLGREKSLLEPDQPYAQITTISALAPTKEVLLKWPFPLKDYEASTCFFRATVTHVEDVPGARADTFMPNLQMKPSIILDKGYLRHCERHFGGKVSVKSMNDYLNTRIDEYYRLTNNNADN